jgi:peptidyl-prolyl cis-trans isomerase C
MSVRLKFGFAAGAAMVLSLAACGGDKTPGGQVVATVNGEEVTLPELNAEAAAANVPENADKKQILPALLQRVVDRKLFAAEAKKKGLDKQADFLVQRRRAEETLLAQALIKPQLQAASVPSASDIGKFIAENPSMFSGRARYRLDQIVFPRPQDVSKLQALETASTLDQVAAKLTELGIQFKRQPAGMDSGTVPAALMKKIEAVPPGEPFVIPVGGAITVSAIVGKQAVAMPDAEAKRMAAALVRQQNSQKMVADQLAGLRSIAKIQYQPGYAPAAAGTGAAGTTGTAGAGTGAAAQ